MIKAYRRIGNPIFAQQWTGDIKTFVKDTIGTDFLDFWLDTLVENDIKVDVDNTLSIRNKGIFKYIIKNTDYVVYREKVDEKDESIKTISIKIFSEEEFNNEYEIIEEDEKEEGNQ